MSQHFAVVSSALVLSSLFQFSKAIYGSHEDPSTYRLLTIPRNCFPQLNHEPRCQFAISNSASPDLKTECINKNGSTSALRIQGEFHILRITCTASFPIDFSYYGIQPTEATFVEWWKEIRPNWNLNDQNYTVEVKVYSVQALFNFYNNPLNSYYEYPNESLPLPTIHDYSRSGNYSFPGIFNKTFGTSFYLFLEDAAKLSFLRNSRSSRMKAVDDKLVLIPCLSSHFNATVTVEGPSGALQKFSWNPITGFVINQQNVSIETLYGMYTCKLFSDGFLVDTMDFHFKKETNESYFGLEGVDTKGTELDINGEADIGGTPYVRYIHPVCKTRDPDDKVDEGKMQLISVPSHNFGRMKLVRQFALPKFVNRSYTAKITKGIDNWDPLVRKIRQPNGVNLRMITIFCSTGYAQKISDFGSSIRGLFNTFIFGLDWATFNRRTLAIEVHFGLETVKHTGEMYIDTEVTFVCRVNVPFLVKPVVWYTKTNNGSFIPVAIDYNLHEDMSTQSIKITNDTREVLCASSYWYSDFWRNISMPLNPQEAVKPEILNLESEYTLTIGSENRNIRCTATGNPPPEVYFEKNGKRMEDVTTTWKSAILLFPKINSSHAGTYTCVAKNVYETRKAFDVVLENEFSRLGLIFGITTPLLVLFLSAMGALIYIKYFRPEKTGLTKQEVEDFKKGLKADEAQLTAEKNDDVHEFVAQRPYLKEYEVSTDRFQIDESKVLGKGAFGLVLEGTVDGTRVAVKTVQRNADKQYLKALLSELKIMIHLGHHDNLINIVGANTKDLRRGFAYVFVKYIPLGNMETYLRKNALFYNPALTAEVSSAKNSISFGPYLMMLWSRQIASGMEYLASKNVIHGDLAARNVLLDETKTVKITDFGLSRHLYDYNNYIKKQQEPLPWRWLALESLIYMTFSKQSDIWSFGVTIWEIFSLGEAPYPGCTLNKEFVESLERGIRMSRPKCGSFKMFELMRGCWLEDPLQRPSFTSMIQKIDALMELETETETANFAACNEINSKPSAYIACPIGWQTRLNSSCETNECENYSKIGTFVKCENMEML